MSAQPIDSPGNVDLAILPADTRPPAWVRSSDVADQGGGEVTGFWQCEVTEGTATVLVAQFVKVDGGRLVLSEPYVDMDLRAELTVQGARDLGRALYAAARVLVGATEATWALLGEDGQQ